MFVSMGVLQILKNRQHAEPRFWSVGGIPWFNPSPKAFCVPVEP